MTGMTKNSINKGFNIAICADGAEICGKHKASQTYVDLKPIDLNYIDIITNKPLFSFYEEDRNGQMV